MKARILVSLLFGCAAVPAFTYAADGAAAPELKSVHLSIYQADGDSSYLPHLVAIDQGYFKDAGLRLEVSLYSEKEDLKPSKDDLYLVSHEKEYSTPKNAEQLTGKGQRYAIPGSDLFLMGRAKVYAIEARTPGLIKAFNVNTQDEKRWNDAILVKKTLNISSLGELDKAQPIGLLGGGQARIPLMKLMLKNSSLKPDDFKYVLLDHSQMSVLKSPAERMELFNSTLAGIDVAYAREPYVSMLLAGGDWKILVNEPLFAKNIFSPWPMTMTLFSSEFLKESPETAQQVAAVYDKSLAFIRENPDKAQEILSGYLETQYGIKGLKPGLCTYLGSRDISESLVQKQSDWYFANGMTVKKIKAGKLLYKAPKRQEKTAMK